MASLSRNYLLTHKHSQATSPSDHGENERLQQFAKDLIDSILDSAHDQLESDSEETDQIDLSLPVKLTPVHDAPEGGCVGINIGIIEYHQDFKGNHPGKG